MRQPSASYTAATPSAAEIVPRFGIVDPLLEQLAISLADALRSGPAWRG